MRKNTKRQMFNTLFRVKMFYMLVFLFEIFVVLLTFKRINEFTYQTLAYMLKSSQLSFSDNHDDLSMLQGAQSFFVLS